MTASGRPCGDGSPARTRVMRAYSLASDGKRTRDGRARGISMAMRRRGAGHDPLTQGARSVPAGGSSHVDGQHIASGFLESSRHRAHRSVGSAARPRPRHDRADNFMSKKICSSWFLVLGSCLVLVFLVICSGSCVFLVSWFVVLGLGSSSSLVVKHPSTAEAPFHERRHS